MHKYICIEVYKTINRLLNVNSIRSIQMHNPKPNRNHLITALMILCSEVLSFSNDSFNYSSQDMTQIRYNQTVEISLSIKVGSGEYTGSGFTFVKQRLHQNTTSNSSVRYNILLFSFQEQSGRRCYFEYFNSSTYQYFEQKNCSQYHNETISKDSLKGCLKLTKCYSDMICFSAELDSAPNIQNVLLFVENRGDPTNNSLFLITNNEIDVISSNVWFYLAIGLVYLFCINLIALAGILIYWVLKYNRTIRKMYRLQLVSEGQKSYNISISSD